jgi:hypothetical protein
MIENLHLLAFDHAQRALKMGKPIPQGSPRQLAGALRMSGRGVRLAPPQTQVEGFRHRRRLGRLRRVNAAGRKRRGGRCRRGGRARCRRQPRYAGRGKGRLGQSRQESLPGLEKALTRGELGDALVETVLIEHVLAGEPVEVDLQGPDLVLIGLLHDALAREEPCRDFVPEYEKPGRRGRPEGEQQEGRGSADQGSARDRNRLMRGSGQSLDQRG